MTGVLLDTNVVSELTRPTPAPPVLAFLRVQDDLWMSTVVLHELEFGLLLLPPGRRRDALRDVLSEFMQRYEDRILSVDRTAAAWAARFRADARRQGRPLDLGDALIAGTAKAGDLSVATRNVTDFRGLDLVVTNPWDFG
ncbi:PIN domain-containing protein [Candidatus Palauibacter sp.]|uniref:PIN domain-containing protein n=1 Tax=Candidatus Palauibacter sp. TaxID=3101350 RepID=UPI003AF26DF5